VQVVVRIPRPVDTSLAFFQFALHRVIIDVTQARRFLQLLERGKELVAVPLADAVLAAARMLRMMMRLASAHVVIRGN
jgi:hypothetical protein